MLKSTILMVKIIVNQYFFYYYQNPTIFSLLALTRDKKKKRDDVLDKKWNLQKKNSGMENRYGETRRTKINFSFCQF